MPPSFPTLPLPLHFFSVYFHGCFPSSFLYIKTQKWLFDSSIGCLTTMVCPSSSIFFYYGTRYDNGYLYSLIFWVRLFEFIWIYCLSALGKVDRALSTVKRSPVEIPNLQPKSPIHKFRSYNLQKRYSLLCTFGSSVWRRRPLRLDLLPHLTLTCNLHRQPRLLTEEGKRTKKKNP